MPMSQGRTTGGQQNQDFLGYFSNTFSMFNMIQKSSPLNDLENSPPGRSSLQASLLHSVATLRLLHCQFLQMYFPGGGKNRVNLVLIYKLTVGMAFDVTTIQTADPINRF